MNHNKTQKGQSLIEILFAIAVFTIGVVTIGYLIIESFSSLSNNLHATQARLLAQEGLEIAMLKKESIEVGVYGILREGNEWSFVPTEDSVGEFTRLIEVTSIDLEVFEVTSTVRWGSSENQRSVSLTTYISNWMQNQDMAGLIDVDINNIQKIASSSTLTGVALLNNSGEDLQITGVILQYDGTQSIDQMVIAGTNVFNSASSSSAVSGEYIDIVDYEILSGTGYKMIDQIAFDGENLSNEYILSLIFEDESRRHVLIAL